MARFYYVPLLGMIALQVFSGLASPIQDSPGTANSWTRLPTIGLGPRQEHSVALVGDDIYVIGGAVPNAESGGTIVGTVEVYNIPTTRWSVASPLSKTMNHINSVGLNGKFYVVGGLTGGAAWVGVPETSFYDPFNDTWTKLADAPADTARGASALGVYGSTIYVAGGLQLLEPVLGGSAESVSIVTSFDTAKGTWNTSLPQLPEPRDHVCGAVVDSTWYVIGGRQSGYLNSKSTVFALDLTNPTAWKRLAPMPTARGGLTCSVLGKSVYTFSGEGDNATTSGVFPEVEVFDTVKNSWAKLPNMRIPRHGNGAVTYGGSIYIPGGGVGVGTGAVGIFESFRP